MFTAPHRARPRPCRYRNRSLSLPSAEQLTVGITLESSAVQCLSWPLVAGARRLAVMRRIKSERSACLLVVLALPGFLGPQCGPGGARGASLDTHPDYTNCQLNPASCGSL